MTADNAGEGASETTDIIGCSVRGQKSVEADIPCQDDNEQRRLTGQRYVIAAADGLGTASLSHVGSGVATQAVAEYVEQALTGTDALDESRLQSVLQEAFAHVREQLDREANSRGVAVSELNTTLLVAVGGPAGVGGAAVGDGGIVWHRGGQTGLLIPREDTEYGNETIPVQSDSWQDSYRFGWMPDADAAAAFSDGLDGVAWDGPMSVSDELFDQVFDNVAEFSNLDKLERFLTDFLDGETLRESSRDDKTLVIGALPTARWSDPEETDPQGSLRTQGYVTRDTGHSRTGPGLDSGSQADSGSRRRTGRRRRERSAGLGSADDRLGGNQTRLVVGAGGIAAVILVVLAGVLLLLTGGGGGAAELNLSTAELRGDEGLLVEGSLGDGEFNDSRNLTVSLGEPGNESLVVQNRSTSVSEGEFSLRLEEEELANATDAMEKHGETAYHVVVETDGDVDDNINLTVEEDTEDGEPESPHEQCRRGTGQTKCSNPSVVSTGGYLFAQVTGTLDQHGPSRGGDAR
jgi:hypothetical protein